jgi:hypothetical protein
VEVDLQRRPGKGAIDPDPKKGTRERGIGEEEEKDFL